MSSYIGPAGAAMQGNLAAKKQGKQRKVFTLWVHDHHFSPEDLVINPDYFPPETKVGDIVEIYKQGSREKKLYMAIGACTSIKANLQLSVKDSIATACDLNNREEIIANVVPKDTVAVDFAEVTFKDQFISRSDMWRLKMHLKETCAYVGKTIQFSCIRAQIRELLVSEQPVHSGYITRNTKIVFRSRSAEYIMFFQMSKEMWDFAPDGQLYFEKAVNVFLPSLFQRWRALGADHCLSMVLFSRTYYAKKDLFKTILKRRKRQDPNAEFEFVREVPFVDHVTQDNTESIQSEDAFLDHTEYEYVEEELCMFQSPQKELLLIDHDGRYFHDFYTVVCIEERSNWERVVMQLKNKFEEYPYMVNWKVPGADLSKYKTSILGVNSAAESSGFLEAINLGQNMLDSRHFCDRDLTRTGQSIVVISAGTGVFITNPYLEQQTKQRMIDKGIGCDLVCITRPPLHIVPLFIMKPPFNSNASNSNSFNVSTSDHMQRKYQNLPPPSPYNSMESQNAKPSFPSHKMAHWVYLFFFEVGTQLDSLSSRMFVPSCKLPDFLLENPPANGILLPLRRDPNSKDPQSRTTTSKKPSAEKDDNDDMVPQIELEDPESTKSTEKLMDEYDDNIFTYAAPQLQPKKPFSQHQTSPISSSVIHTPSSSFIDASKLERHHQSLRSPSRNRADDRHTTERKELSAISLTPGSGKVRVHGSSSVSQNQNQNGATYTPYGSMTQQSSSLNSDNLKTPSRHLSNTAVASPLAISQSKQNDTMINVNPFNLELKIAPPASNRRRWEHLWYRAATQYEFVEADPQGPHWKSLSQPASLPLTTAYFPSVKDLNDNFQDYVHGLIPEEGVHQMNLQAHLQECIAQRLVQGYQIMLPSNSSNTGTSNTTIAGQQEIGDLLTRAYLSAGHSFHKLAINKPNINVNLYLAKNKLSQRHQPIDYRYFLWTEHTSRMLTKTARLHYQSVLHYPWNSVDQLLMGHELHFIESKYNFWRVNMMLVPQDRNMSYQTGVNGFNKFKEFLSQRIVKLPDPDFCQMKVHIVSAPLHEPRDEAQDQISSDSKTSTKFGTDANAVANSKDDLIEPHNTNLILAALKESGLLNERYFKSESSNQQSGVFVASKVIDWMMMKVNLRQRSQAIEICTFLLSNGIFKPISLKENSMFRDGANYYGLAEMMTSNPTVALTSSDRRSSLGKKELQSPSPMIASASIPMRSASDVAKQEDRSVSQSLMINHIPAELGLDVPQSHQRKTIHHTIIQTGSNPAEASVLDPEYPKVPEDVPNHSLFGKRGEVEQGTMRLQMDPSKTNDHYEWMNVVYDTIFDPKVAYELEFQWLSCTGCVLSDFLTQCARKAKGFGLSLVQIPVDHKAQHVFLSPRKGSFIWSELSAHHQQAIGYVLVTVLDFIPRKSPNQFIHRTGVIIIDISDGSFEWTVNWTDVNAYTTAQNFELLKRFRDFMAEVEVLKGRVGSGEDMTYSDFVNCLLRVITPTTISSQMISNQTNQLLANQSGSALSQSSAPATPQIQHLSKQSQSDIKFRSATGLTRSVSLGKDQSIAPPANSSTISADSPPASTPVLLKSISTLSSPLVRPASTPLATTKGFDSQEKSGNSPKKNEDQMEM